MMKHIKNIIMACVLGVSPLFSQAAEEVNTPDIKSIKDNILVLEWNTPYQTPPFDKIKDEDFVPAMQYSIDVARAEVNSIIKNKQEPTFYNTIEALDASGRLLNRVAGVLFNLMEADYNQKREDAIIAITPQLTTYENDISLNEDLFARVKAVYEKKDSLNLNAEQKMLLEKTYKGFSKNGANLGEADKDRYRAITQELSELSLKVSTNVLKDRREYSLPLTKKSDLSGLHKDMISQAAKKAKEQEKKGWIFDLSEPSYIPFMKYADNRELRREMYIAYSSVAIHENQYNNESNIKRIAELRMELAQLLGYKTYADYVLEEKMAKTSEEVNAFLKDLVSYSMPAAKRDIRQLQEYANSKGFEGDLQAWDVSYYMEKLRLEKYMIDDQMLKPYLELDKVKEGIFNLVSKLYGLRFERSTEVPTYNKDVEVYKVYDSDKLMAVLYMDFFARQSKRGGAWMTSFREQYIDETASDIRPLVQVVLNFPTRDEDGKCLLTFSDFSTFLHEFGHALHGMLSECKYLRTSGTNVAGDFVELPSQIMENWGTEKEFLDMFAHHYQTGEPISPELVQKLIEVQKFMAGYLSMRQLTYGTLDMAWHTIIEPVEKSVINFEKKAQSGISLLPTPQGCNMSVQFTHIFGGGYAAGYYGYKWAELLDADAFSLFKENGIFDTQTASSFRKNILSKGGSEDPMDLYIRFRGREPQLDALLERGGLIQKQ